MATDHQLKDKFWTAFAASPFVFVQLDTDPHTAIPMTAQLDRDADGTIWFFHRRTGPLAAGGVATATLAAKDHRLFARFTGRISREPNRNRLEQFWAPAVEAWFPGGKNDPDLTLLRMDLGQAEIWNADMGFIDTARMLLGFDVRDEAAENHTEAAL